MYIVTMSQRNPPQEQIDYILNLFKSNKIQQALDFIDTLSKDYPDKSLLLNIRGACYASLGQLDIAVQNYEKALSIKPDYAKAHYNLGNVLHELRKHQKAISCYEKAIQIQPNYANAHYNLGLIFKELGEFQKAINCY